MASGGELSRIMLGLKGVLFEKDPVPVSLFDEVDTGVGGAIAEIIGEKLEAIAQDRQVICITHLAQIAVKADHHLLVAKSSQNSRTKTTIKVLDKKAHTVF